MLHTILKEEPGTRPEEASTNQSVSDNSDSKELSFKHYQQCCGTDVSKKQRGLNREWIEANCRSLDIKEATEMLRYSAQSGGIAIEGVEWSMSVKTRQALGWEAREESTKVQDSSGR